MSYYQRPWRMPLIIAVMLTFASTVFGQTARRGTEFEKIFSEGIRSMARSMAGYKKIVACEQGLWMLGMKGGISFKPRTGKDVTFSVQSLIQDAAVAGEESIYVLTEQDLLLLQCKNGAITSTLLFRSQKTLFYLEIMGFSEKGLWLRSLDSSLDLISAGKVGDRVQVASLRHDAAVMKEPIILFSDNVAGTVYLALMWGRGKFGYALWDASARSWDNYIDCGATYPSPLIAVNGQVRTMMGNEERSVGKEASAAHMPNRSVRNLYACSLGRYYSTCTLTEDQEGNKSMTILVVDAKGPKWPSIVQRSDTKLHGQVGVLASDDTVSYWLQDWQAEPQLSSIPLLP
jgi:hypothetical protein